MLNKELVKTVKNLIKNGTRFNVEILDEIYHEDLRISRRESGDALHVIDKSENLAFFRSKRNVGAKPLSPEATFLYAHASGPVGHVVLERKMQLRDNHEHLLYNIVLRKVEEQWTVVSEFVLPLNGR
ncbi:MAG: hypothetical protein PVH63_04940 [Balneolaceae bacterium]|jgi:hypothetical protein